MKRVVILILLIAASVATASATSPGILRPIICPYLAEQAWYDTYDSCIGHVGPPPSGGQQEACRDEANSAYNRTYFGCMNFGYGMFSAQSREFLPKSHEFPFSTGRERSERYQFARIYKGWQYSPKRC